MCWYGMEDLFGAVLTAWCSGTYVEYPRDTLVIDRDKDEEK